MVKELNRNHAIWTVSEISKRKGTPHYLANEELADDIFPFVKEEFPEALMVKFKTESYGEQFIVITKRAQSALIKLLKARKDNYERCIREVDSAIELIKSTRP